MTTEDETISDELQRRYDSATSEPEKLSLMVEFFGSRLAEKMLAVMEGGHDGDAVDLSKTGGCDPRES